MEHTAGLMLSDDLIFISKVRVTAEALGLRVQSARDSAKLVELARQVKPRGVLVDLHNPGLMLEELLRQLEEACGRRPRIVAYGSHVEAATLRAAREAGCDLVLPRSQFVEQLPAALAGWIG